MGPTFSVNITNIASDALAIMMTPGIISRTSPMSDIGPTSIIKQTNGKNFLIDSFIDCLKDIVCFLTLAAAMANHIPVMIKMHRNQKTKALINE